MRVPYSQYPIETIEYLDEKTVVKYLVRYLFYCIQGTPDIYIEIWHANTFGQYDNCREMKYRCRIKTDANGSYGLTTILPGRYKMEEHIDHVIFMSELLIRTIQSV